MITCEEKKCGKMNTSMKLGTDDILNKNDKYLDLVATSTDLSCLHR